MTQKQLNISYSSFILKETIEFSAWDGSLYIFEHTSGAMAYYFCCQDPNKVFYTAFKTAPFNNQGAAHVIEHMLLCGSKRYPVKDTFSELQKGSLNTYLNALTYPDRTVYPIASTCSKDFFNMAEVYLDGVFNASFHENGALFLQEGGSARLLDINKTPQISGVVYNEMKTMWSDPDYVMNQKIRRTLFPHSCYIYDGAGFPDDIVQLTLGQVESFYKKWYAPSNALFYFYGDCDIIKALAAANEAIDRWPYPQSAAQAGYKESYYMSPLGTRGFGSYEHGGGQHCYALAMAPEISGDRQLRISFEILNDIFTGLRSSPLRQSIYANKQVRHFASYFNTDIATPYFLFSAKFRQNGQALNFQRALFTAFREAANGIPPEVIDAAIGHYRFKLTQRQFGYKPAGLALGLDLLECWQYGMNPREVELSETYFKKVEEMSHQGYFEDLIKKFFLSKDRMVSAYLPAKPKNEATKYQYTEKEKERIISQTKQLLHFQQTPDNPQALLAIPKLNLTDIPDTTSPVTLFSNSAGQTDYYLCKQPPASAKTVVGLNLYFDLSHIQQSVLAQVSFLCKLLGKMPTNKHSGNQLVNKVHQVTGALSFSVEPFANQYGNRLAIHTRLLKENIPAFFDLIEEILLETKLKDERLLKETLHEEKNKFGSMLLKKGDDAAKIRAMSYYAPLWNITDRTSGIGYYDTLCNFNSGELQAELQYILHHVFQKQTNTFVVAIEQFEDNPDNIRPYVDRLLRRLPLVKSSLKGHSIKVCPVHEGFIVPSATVFCALSMQSDLQDRAMQALLKSILDNGYLWPEVRNKTGAYGSQVYFNPTGEICFSVQSSPVITPILDIFAQTSQFLSCFAPDGKDLDQYKIGALRTLNVQIWPEKTLHHQLISYLRHFESSGQNSTIETRIKDATITQIKESAQYFSAMVSSSGLCAIGDKKTLLFSRDKLTHIRALYMNF